MISLDDCNLLSGSANSTTLVKKHIDGNRHIMYFNKDPNHFQKELFLDFEKRFFEIFMQKTTLSK